MTTRIQRLHALWLDAQIRVLEFVLYGVLGGDPVPQVEDTNP